MRGRGSIFEDLLKLNQMLELRRQGHGPSELGRKYGVDHTTIVYHCKRHGLVMDRRQNSATYSGSMPPPVIVEKRVRISIANGEARVIMDEYDGTPINPGRNYGEYLENIQKRKEDRLLKRNTGSQ